jgi:5-methylcytosine-specific restriction endonuclease McrA
LLNVEEGRQERPRNQRQPIPREIRRPVFERDGGSCVEYDSTFDRQYDHVIPVALGGATSLDNLQLLCGDCNRTKGADL